MKRVNELIPIVSQRLQIPPHTIQLCVDSFFTKLYSFIKSKEHPFFTFQQFGSLRPQTNRIYYRTKTLIKKYREEPTPEKLEEIRTFVRLYKKARQYDESTQYKKRFGSWHWKKDYGIQE